MEESSFCCGKSESRWGQSSTVGSPADVHAISIVDGLRGRVRGSLLLMLLVVFAGALAQPGRPLQPSTRGLVGAVCFARP